MLQLKTSVKHGLSFKEFMRIIWVFSILFSHLAFGKVENFNLSLPWEREITGIELLVASPVLWRYLGIDSDHRDVEHPAEAQATFGHILFRLVDDGPIKDQWTVGVSADLDQNRDGIEDQASIFKGFIGGIVDNINLFGPSEGTNKVEYGYAKFLDLMTIEQAEVHFLDKSDRVLSRYIIPTSSSEIAELKTLLKDYYEKGLKWENGSYSFLFENCSTEITQIFNKALIDKKSPLEFNLPTSVPDSYGEFGLITPLIKSVSFDLKKLHGPSSDKNWGVSKNLLRLCSGEDHLCQKSWIDSALNKIGVPWLKKFKNYFRGANGEKGTFYYNRFGKKFREKLSGYFKL